MADCSLSFQPWLLHSDRHMPDLMECHEVCHRIILDGRMLNVTQSHLGMSASRLDRPLDLGGFTKLLDMELKHIA